MKLTAFASGGNVFVDCECVKGFAFKKVAMGVNYALLPVIIANYDVSRANYAHFSRVECLLPQRCSARR